jgi:phosphotransferase system HPr-like phosphotransfer protein
MAEDNTPTNVVDDLLDGYKTIKLKITDPNGLHTRPATQLLQDVYAVGNQYGVDYPFIMKNGNLIEGGLATLVKENIKFGETLTLYIPENIPNIKFNESNNYYELVDIPDTPTNVVDDFGQKGIKWADARKALENVNNWGEDIPILEERFIGNTNDKIILEIIPPEGNVEGLIPSEDYRLQASILRENGDIEIIKTYDNPRQFGADGKNFFNDISS